MSSLISLILHPLISLILFPLISFNAHADDQERPLHPGHRDIRGNEHSERVSNLTVGDPVYSGGACPNGTVRAVFAPDNLSFSILFDQFVAAVPTDKTDKNGHRDQMACGALIPMRLPAGYQMEITRIDYRGFVALPQGSRAQLHSVFNFRGPDGDRERINLRYAFQGPVMDNYEVSSDAIQSVGGAPVREASPCGGPTRLWILTQLTLLSPSAQQASVTVDSVDGSSHAIYYVNWKKCGTG